MDVDLQILCGSCSGAPASCRLVRRPVASHGDVLPDFRRRGSSPGGDGLFQLCRLIDTPTAVALITSIMPAHCIGLNHSPSAMVPIAVATTGLASAR